MAHFRSQETVESALAMSDAGVPIGSTRRSVVSRCRRFGRGAGGINVKAGLAGAAGDIRLVKPTASPCLRSGQGMIRIEARLREIVAECPEQLLRGLFHSDGCRIVNWASKPGRDKRYYYVRYMFSNKSDDIRNILTDALDLLGIAWRRPRWDLVAVSRREAVAVLDTFVGPKS